MWLAVALCEPMELHACPMHDSMSSMAGMPGMSMPAGAGAAIHGQAAPAAFAVCTCLTCCGTSSVAPPESSRVLPGSNHGPAGPVDAGGAIWPRIQRAHAHPFGTAPPLAASLI